MPNMKIYVDETVWSRCREALIAELGPIRDLLCRDLGVDHAACQLAVVPVHGLPDQPLVNVEFFILPKPDRGREVIRSLCEDLRRVVGGATGTHVAVRAALLDPETYLALK